MDLLTLQVILKFYGFLAVYYHKLTAHSSSFKFDFFHFIDNCLLFYFIFLFQNFPSQIYLAGYGLLSLIPHLPVGLLKVCIFLYFSYYVWFSDAFFMLCNMWVECNFYLAYVISLEWLPQMRHIKQNMSHALWFI